METMKKPESLKALADKVLERNRRGNREETKAGNIGNFQGQKEGQKFPEFPVNPDLMSRVMAAVAGLSITPAQFLAIINADDKQGIINDEFTQQTLHAYASSFAAGLTSGRIVLHPASGVLVKHGIKL